MFHQPQGDLPITRRLRPAAWITTICLQLREKLCEEKWYINKYMEKKIMNLNFYNTDLFSIVDSLASCNIEIWI